MKYFLNCPFDEKEEAKALGAMWDKSVRRWYYESDKVESRFDKWQGPNGTQRMYKDRNLDNLQSCISSHVPFIVFDVETTGIMNGANNKITQLALSLYQYNENSHKYEMQDHLFMLVKADKTAIDAIQLSENIPDSAVIAKLQEEYLYSLTTLANQCKHELIKLSSDYDSLSMEAAICTDKNKESELEASMKDVKGQIDRRNDFLDVYHGLIDNGKMNMEYVSQIDDCKEYVTEHFESKKAEMQKNPTVSLDSILFAQGIDKTAWLESGDGLSLADIQLGLSAFLKNNFKENTIVITNGVKYVKHYLEKENLHFTADGAARPFKAIDIIKAAKEYSDIHITQANKFACNFKEFADIFKLNTGKEIQNFDAFTKTICMAEMVCRVTGSAAVHSSEKDIKNSIKEAVMLDTVPDENTAIPYVLDSAAVTSLKWDPENTPYYSSEDGSRMFDALEYINFGNNKRYTDIDKLFEINKDFVITLEGEKTPIKSWDELEAKIKSYNADISSELLERIKYKFKEVEASIIEWQSEVIVPASEKPIDKISLSEEQTDKNALQEILQNKLMEFDFNLIALEEESKICTSEYEAAFNKTLIKANNELPSLNSFVNEVKSRIDRTELLPITFEIYKEYELPTTVTVRENDTKNGFIFKINGDEISWSLQKGFEKNDSRSFAFFVENYEEIKNIIIGSVEVKVENYLSDVSRHNSNLKEKTHKMQKDLLGKE